MEQESVIKRHQITVATLAGAEELEELGFVRVATTAMGFHMEIPYAGGPQYPQASKEANGAR